jgi:alkanesulfonate monooxygenase SsuD/methylene tetrahydromethanopterin reductase-like flavin-dependent oxidoreductase (luciferase family)
MKLLLVGGNPKGYEEAFDPETLSGRRLRAIVKQVGADAEYLDLWADAKEEREESFSEEKFWKIWVAEYEDGRTVIGLGRKVAKALEHWSFMGPRPFDFVPLPHPASRRPIDWKRLREGLAEQISK